MSTMTAEARTTTPLRVREPKPRFVDLCAAEWIKLRSLRSTYFVVALTILAVLFINLNGVRASIEYIDQPRRFPLMPGEKPWVYDPLWRSLNDIGADILMLAAASIGGIAVFGEYSTGLVRTTFAAVPDRRGVIAAKIVVLTLLMTAVGYLVAVISFAGGQAMLASHHVGMAFHDPEAWRAISGYALIMPVAGLIGMAFGAVIRNATGSIVAVVAFLFFLPALFGGEKYRWVNEIGKLFPGHAESRIAWWSHSNGTLGKWPPSLTHAWSVYAGWAVLSVIVTIVVVKKRDV
jgi:ABC-2 type transport system permease protein